MTTTYSDSHIIKTSHARKGSTSHKFLENRFNRLIDEYREALKINERDISIWLKLGDAILENNNPQFYPISLACFRKAIEIDPNNPASFHRLGNVYKLLGKNEEAIFALHNALELDPQNISIRFSLLAVQCPILYKSKEEILSCREGYTRQLDGLYESIDFNDSRVLGIAARAVGKYPFHLAYQGYNDRDLQQRYGNLVCRIQGEKYRHWNQPLKMWPLQPSEPIRVGFVSGFFRSHATWNFLTGGWIRGIDHKKFELFGYHTGNINDECTEIARHSFHHWVEGDFSFSSLCERILGDKLHVLIYPEIGMNRLVIRLSALRLAPIQCTSWGHSTTSGLPTIDYFLSSDLMEPPDAQTHYTEKLILLPNMGSYYFPPGNGPHPDIKGQLGLKKGGVLYLCLQSLFKYLPEYDYVFPRIAKKVRNSQFIFITGRQTLPVVNIFRRRLEHAFGSFGLKFDDHVLFLPSLPASEYFSLHSSADVFLDSVGWSGCNTTMDAIAYNLPVVTFPGLLMRGRQSLGILKMMGVTDTVTNSVEDYINMASKLGSNDSFRKEIRARIGANKHKLYEDKSCIEALETFWKDAVKDSLSECNNYKEKNNK